MAVAADVTQAWNLPGAISGTLGAEPVSPAQVSAPGAADVRPSGVRTVISKVFMQEVASAFKEVLERLEREHLREMSELRSHLASFPGRDGNVENGSGSAALDEAGAVTDLAEEEFPGSIRSGPQLANLAVLRSQASHNEAADSPPEPPDTKVNRVVSFAEDSADCVQSSRNSAEGARLLPPSEAEDTIDCSIPEGAAPLRKSSQLRPQQSVIIRTTSTQSVHSRRSVDCKTFVSTDSLASSDSDKPSSYGDVALKVSIISASNLRRADWSIGALSDPYCICQIDCKPWTKGQTRVIETTLSPTWDYEYLICDYEEGDDLQFSVYDQDDGRATGDFLGNATLHWEQFEVDGFSDHIPLLEAGKNEANIYVRIEIVTILQDCLGLSPAWMTTPFRGGPPMGYDRAYGSIQSVGSVTNAFQTMSNTQNFDDQVSYFSCLLRPDSTKRLVWDLLGLVILILDLILIPMQAFDPPEDEPLSVLNWTILVYWAIDIFATLNTGYLTREGRVVLRRGSIFKNYIRGWMTLDVLLVGLEVANHIQKASGDSNGGVSDGAGAARAGKLGRLFRLARLLRLMRLAKLRQVLFTTQQLINSEWLTIAFVVCRNLLAIVSLNHYLACVWFAIGSAADGWVDADGYRSYPWARQYLVSLQWSLAQFTPGAAPIKARSPGEEVYSVSVLILGMVVATCFVSSITSALAAVWSMQRNTAMQQLLLKKFLNQNGISRSLGSRVTRFVDNYIEFRQRKVHTSKVDYISVLSGPLKVELLTELWQPHLIVHHKFMLCKSICPSGLKQVCFDAISNIEFGKGDIIFKGAAKAAYMYFLRSGTLAYRYYAPGDVARGQPLALKMQTGQWCTEAALWMTWMHRGNMKAICYADVVAVKATIFADVARSKVDMFKYACSWALHFRLNFDDETAIDILDGDACIEGHYCKHEHEMQKAEDEEIELQNFTEGK